MASTARRSNQFKLDATRPLYAAVGAGDLALEFARGAASDVQSRLERLQSVDLQPQAVREQAINRFETRLSGLQADAKALPIRVERMVSDYVTELNKAYEGLASRGEGFVARVRRQEATKRTQAAAETTTAKARTTRTQTKKTAKTAGSSAKATGTSAKNTASAAKKATTDAASKAGN